MMNPVFGNNFLATGANLFFLRKIDYYGTRTCNPHVLDTWLLNEASLSKIKKTCLS